MEPSAGTPLGGRRAAGVMFTTLGDKVLFLQRSGDYGDHGGEWAGQAFMCTREKEFTIKGTADCLARGFDRTGFFEVDTGEPPSWTVQLTEPAELAPKTPLQSRVPPVQPPAGAGRPPTTPAPAAPKSKN